MRVRNTQEFGAVIKQARKSKGLTQQQLAEYCHCSIMYLSALERGKDTAQIGIALRIANTLGLNIEVRERA